MTMQIVDSPTRESCQRPHRVPVPVPVSRSIPVPRASPRPPTAIRRRVGGQDVAHNRPGARPASISPTNHGGNPMTDELTAEQPFGVVRYRTIFSGVTAARVVPPRVRPSPTPPPRALRGFRVGAAARLVVPAPVVMADALANHRTSGWIEWPSCAPARPTGAALSWVPRWAPRTAHRPPHARFCPRSAWIRARSGGSTADPGLRGRHRSGLTRVHGRRGWVEQVKVPHHRATLRNATRRATRRP